MESCYADSHPTARINEQRRASVVKILLFFLFFPSASIYGHRKSTIDFAGNVGHMHASLL